MDAEVSQRVAKVLKLYYRAPGKHREKRFLFSPGLRRKRRLHSFIFLLLQKLDLILLVPQWSQRAFNFTTEHTEGTEKKVLFSPADCADCRRRSTNQQLQLSEILAAMGKVLN